MNGERSGAVRASIASYDVGGLLPAGSPDTVSAGTSVLITGPPMTGKVDLALSVFERGVEQGEPALVVSPDAGADRIRERFPSADLLHVVDCSGGGVSFDDTASVKFVGSPGDLTGIGIGLTKCNQAIGPAATRGVRLGVLSLSTVLRYAHVDPVFSFVHLLTGRIDAAGYLGVFTLDSTSHDPQVVQTVRAQFDGVVELREANDGTVEGRVLGLEGGSREWTPV